MLAAALAVAGLPAFAAAAGSNAGRNGSAQAAQAGSEHAGAAPCFFRQQWKGLWKVTPDARTMYVRVARRVYRLELATAYPLLKSPWAVVSDRDSSNTICSPIDFRLVVTDRLGAHQAVIVKHMARLTPAEAASLPKKLRP
ncbi:MAG: hypothetical protein ACREU3_05050 [Steroidobacteraceae bacterium]